MPETSGHAEHAPVGFQGFPCGECGYAIMSSADGERCPECGAALDAENRRRAIGPTRLDEPFSPSMKIEQIATRGASGMLGLSVCLLGVVVGGFMWLIGDLVWPAIICLLVAGCLGMSLGALGAWEGQRYNLPRHGRMGSRSLVVGMVILFLGVVGVFVMLFL